MGMAGSPGKVLSIAGVHRPVYRSPSGVTPYVGSQDTRELD